MLISLEKNISQDIVKKFGENMKNKKILTSEEIRKRFLDFFKKRSHTVIPSSPLIPENDSSVLFNTAGMQPLVPYLLGEEHPKGKRLTNIQKCVRTQDIDEVGDNTHDTFFEMLGNWSLGDYFKKNAIKWTYEFLTSSSEGLGLDKNKMYITVFAGNKNISKDEESKKIWMDLGISENRIYYLEDNWWSAGDSGPCGPDTEIFYDVSDKNLGDLTRKEFLKADQNQELVEIGNNVLMEYEQEDGKIIGKLLKKNIDFGGGLERMAMAVQEKNNIYDTDLFFDLIEKISENSKRNYKKNKKDFRIIADHIRTSVFLISDGVRVSNKDQGYILRRLLRRSLIKMDNISFDVSFISSLVNVVINKYFNVYPNLKENKNLIVKEIEEEMQKFFRTLQNGMKEFKKIIDLKNDVLNVISGDDIFKLYTTYGFPFEIIQEEAEKRRLTVDAKGFQKRLKEHQKQSQTASAGKFKGGLGGDSPKITAFHTATHLMLAGLKKYVGEHVSQKGSNITEERVRFDFSNDGKVERKVLDKIEEYVNSAINSGVLVEIAEMNKQKAMNEGITGAFWEKYPDIVKVYSIVGEDGSVYSRELCAGPHVKDSSDIAKFGKFKIKKESSSSAGVRRIKAIFEK